MLFHFASHIPMYFCTGFHNVYKRLVEGIKVSGLSKQQQIVVKDNIKHAFRFPSTAFNTLMKNETAEFIVNYAESIIHSSSSKLPPFFRIYAELLYKQTPFGKITDIIRKIAGKSL